MTYEQAKFILQAYRPGQEGLDTPEWEEAVRLLEADEELRRWFEKEQAFDQAFGAKLEAIEVPNDLADSILAQVVEKEGQVVEFPWWKQFSAWGAAASILLVLGLALILPEREPAADTAMTIESFQEFAGKALKTSKGFNLKSNEWSTLVQYLDEHQAPTPSTLPGRVTDMPAMGCMTLSIEEKPVGVICFGKKSKSHLFVINSEDFPQLPVKEKPVINRNSFSSSAYWSKNDKHYLMLSYDPDELSQFVSF